MVAFLLFSTSMSYSASADILWLKCEPTGKPVSCIVDGDTLWKDSVKYRINGLDTPQLEQSMCTHEHQLAEQATQALISLLNNTVSKVIPTSEIDDLKQPLANAYAGNYNIADLIIAQGLGVEYKKRENRKEWRTKQWCQPE